MNCEMCMKKLIKPRTSRRYCAECSEKRSRVRWSERKHTREELIIQNVIPWNGMEEYRKQCERVEKRFE